MGRRRVRTQRTIDWRLPIFLAAVFAVKCVVLAQLQHHPLLEPDGGVDSAEYVALARRVLDSDVLLGPGLYYLSPLYIYFLAALLAVSNSFTFVRVVQVALGTAAVWCMFVSARAWFGGRAGWIAAALAALTGVFTFYEIVIFQSSIDVFLTSAALACLAEGLSRQGDLPPEGGSYRTSRMARQVAPGFSREMLTAGSLLGLQFLNRPNIAIAIAGMVVVLLATRRWRLAMWLAAGAAIAIAPIAVRNALVTYEFALTSSQGGLNFYIGNNAAATGQYVAVANVRANMAGQAEDTRKVAESAAGHALTDAQVSSYFSGLALSWIRDHPADAGKGFLRKLALTFNARHQWLDYSYPYYAYDAGSILGWLFVGPWLLVPLGFVGAALLLTGSSGSSGSAGSSGSRFTGSSGSRFAGSPGSKFAGSSGSRFAGSPGSKFARSGFVWFVFVPAYAVSVALFFVAERYRLPLFVPLCVLSGGALDWALNAFRKPSFVLRPPSSAAAAASAVALLIAGVAVTAWPFTLEDGRYDERLRLAKVLMNDHDYGAAAMELARAFESRPSDTATEFNLGMALVTTGRVHDGLEHARHAVDAGVPIAGARYALANAMLMTGDREAAVAMLRASFPASDDTAESCFQVAQLAMNADAPLVAERYLRRALALRPGWPDALQALQQLNSRIPK